jgi:dTDP-4-dehydrorhamnose reductase
MPGPGAIAVFGAGFLGTRLADALPGATLEHGDITDRERVRAALTSGRYRAVVNAAGKTGRPNVDWCETHEAETHRSNVVGPLVLAEVCAEVGCYLLHLGSGCVFHGPAPQPEGWLETDRANPSTFYARTKYEAELALSELPDVGIARLRMPLDAAPAPRNLITKLAGYEHVIDVENSVTVVDDLIGAVRRLIDLRATGIFHVTNPGTLRHRDLLALYTRLVDPAHAYSLIRDEDLVAMGLARKPRSNCILASTRLSALGVQLRPIDVALHDAMSRYARLWAA